MQPSFTHDIENKTVHVDMSGDWSRNALSRSTASPSRELVTATTALLDRGGCDRLVLSAHDLEGWDSLLLSACLAMVRSASSRGMEADYSSLPGGMSSMLSMALAVPPPCTSPFPHRPRIAGNGGG